MNVALSNSYIALWGLLELTNVSKLTPVLGGARLPWGGPPSPITPDHPPTEAASFLHKYMKYNVHVSYQSTLFKKDCEFYNIVTPSLRDLNGLLREGLYGVL